MVRVRKVPADEVTGTARQVYDRAESYGPFSSLVGTMANRPPILEHTFGLLLDLKAEGVLPKRYLEIALVAVSKVNECTYCVSNHTPRLSAEAGISQTAVLNILDYKNSTEFTEVDKLVIEYAIKVTKDFHRVPDKLMNRLKSHFDDAQIVELTWRIALCGAFNRFNDVLQTEVDDGVDVIDQEPPK
uniref:Carboxymuconolactone decarboxylase-like domain-containing protein n=1 Tax=Attheya septentrionalis TaxID=420275 RepID=A0A7S2XIZ7_9STRA|mmetsp:Transcript_13237/g.24027  ORF Transcript_13237/g.24027 Transcript_13237/m.24027 type:complete len:187 (+) Transcript_13237:290-850(+)